MTHPDITTDALIAASQQAMTYGLTPGEAVICGWAQLTGHPLDPRAFDDAALILRAERLLTDGLPIADAIATARTEHATWATPKAHP